MARLPNALALTEADWDGKLSRARELARACRLCPHRCGIDRLAGQKGRCGAGGELRISSVFPHHGEEPPLSGTGGSGTAFFSHCTLRCVFCQNWQLSHNGEGQEYTVDEFAQQLMVLQQRGCHNVNLVTPGHFLPWVLDGLHRACRDGLRLPLVYNCGGYETPECLEVLDGVVDIYLPDMKYGKDREAAEFSGATDYVSVNQEAIRLMFRQVGPLRLDSDGVAVSGLCIRHLVLPNDAAGSSLVVAFLAAAFDPGDITVSVMAQYRPLHRAGEHPAINRPVTAAEYRQARDAFRDAGFDGFYQNVQELDSSFVIDFTRRKHERLDGH